MQYISRKGLLLDRKLSKRVVISVLIPELVISHKNKLKKF